MSKRILVLGGTGFIGKELVKELHKNAHDEVICATRNPSQSPYSSSQFVDIYNADSLKKILKQVTHVINCVGQITPESDEMIQQNSVGIINIAQAVKQHSVSLIHLSTVAVYGSHHTVDESTSCVTETPYSAAKLGAEYLLRDIVPRNQLTILRLSNIYGTHSKGIIGYFLRAYKSDRKLSFDNDGTLTRFYLHVSDCANIIHSVIETHLRSGTYNLVGPDKYSIKELVHLLKKSTQKKWTVTYEKSKPKENIEWISMEKLKKELGIEFRESMVTYFQNTFHV